MDNDDDLLIFSSISASRVRDARGRYDQDNMRNEGATTWGATRRIRLVAQYIARNPPSAERSTFTLPDPRFDTSTDEMKRAGVTVRKQQANTQATVADKARKIAEQVAKRGATAAPPGERPAKTARGTGGGNLPGLTQTGTQEPPTSPPTEGRQSGGLFVTPSPGS